MSANGRASRGLLAATCHLALFLFALHFGGTSVILPYLGAAFKLGSAVEGRLFPATFSGFIIGVLLCGYLSDRWGRKVVLLAAIAAYSLGLFLTAFVPIFSLALVAAALIGAGSGAIETVASALAADLFPERRAFLLNAVQVAFGAGAAIGPYSAHVLLTHGTDWRTLYLSLAAAQAALFLLLVIQRIPGEQSSSEAIVFPILLRVFRQPTVLALCLAQGLYVGAEVAFASWMPTYFRNSLPHGASWEGLVVTVFWIAMTAGRIGVGPVIGKMPLLRLAILLASGGVVGAVLTLVWTSPWIVICFVALTGLCFSGIFGLILAEAGARFPTVSGSVFGGIAAAGGLGGAIIPWAVALLAGTALHWRGALLIIPAAMAGVAMVLYSILRLEHNAILTSNA